MRYLVSGKQMKEIDRYAIEEIGLPSMVLMERAALAVFEEVKKSACKNDIIWSICGTGNNGADGIAAARLLYEAGYLVSVILAGNDKIGTEGYQRQRMIAEKIGVSVIEFCDFIPDRCDMIIDAVFGVGLDRSIGGGYRKVLEFLNDQNPRMVVAVDIPSGIHADTGAVMGIAVKADVTVTFGYEKLGTALYPGKSYCGHVVIAGIGFPQICLSQVHSNTYTYEPSDIKLIPKRAEYSNKGSFGKVLFVAGSKNMSGAAYLSALSAYRIGAGLVKILTVEENRIILQEQLPEAIIETYDPMWPEKDESGFFKFIEHQCSWASVIVLGPGLGQKNHIVYLVEAVLRNVHVPLVLDADGLNAVAQHPALTAYYSEHVVITPHLGEMSRLIQKEIPQIQEAILGIAETYSKNHGLTCVLKDAVTIVARQDGLNYINTSGCSAMAKAGAGDVLTGVIAGLLALGLKTSEAAALGVYLHGLAGELAAKKLGNHGVLAGDLANALAEASYTEC